MDAITTRRMKILGRTLSHASWVLPVFAFIMAMINANTTYFPLVVAGGICGIMGLAGMLLWGTRGWAFAAIGLAISLFQFLDGKYGGF
jgi:hypothetical protein